VSPVSKPNPNPAKSSQAPAKPKQRKSKEKALIFFDSLVGIEPFQRVAPTPRPEKCSPSPFPSGSPWARLAIAKLPRFLIFAKKIRRRQFLPFSVREKVARSAG
jgi:hypothetical protein